MSAHQTEEFLFQDDPFFFPQLPAELDGEKREKILCKTESLRYSKRIIFQIRNDMMAQAVKALDDGGETSFPMVNTFVHRFPTGNETGTYLGLDIGGTNLRIVRVVLRPPAKPEIQMERFEPPIEVRRNGSERFFGFIADSIGQALKSFGDIPEHKQPIPLGFTFSFGFHQLALDRGHCFMFGIATNIQDAIGKCPREMLQEAIDSRSLPVRVVALMNDSTATLIYGRSLDPNCHLGLILGSGSNVAYVERVERDKRFKKNPAEIFGTGDTAPEEFVINSECVLYGDKHEFDFAKSKYDLALDAESLIPGTYTFEKMVGGAFLGDLTRRCLLDLISDGLLLSGVATAEIQKSTAIESADLSRIESDENETKRLLENLGYPSEQISSDDLKIVLYICRLFTVRSAILCAIETSAFIKLIGGVGKKPITNVGCDGSLFSKHPRMARLINGYLSLLIQDCEGCTATVFDAKDGSSIGAALVAACHHQ